MPGNLLTIASTIMCPHGGQAILFTANAGVMAIPDRQLTAEGWELHLATNYLGHFALARGLRASLRAGSGRVVVLSSGAQLRRAVDFEDPQFARQPYDPWAAYFQSKTADVLLVVGIARHWAEDGITANAANPGYIMTNLQRHLDDDTLRAFGVTIDKLRQRSQRVIKSTCFCE